MMQTIAETILQHIRNEYERGKTQAQIAQDLHVSQQTIQVLLAKHEPPMKITIGTIQRMFPKAVIYLDGPPQGSENSSVHNEDQSVTIGENALVANGIVKGNVITKMDSAGNCSGIPADVLSSIIGDSRLSALDKAIMIREILKK